MKKVNKNPQDPTIRNEFAKWNKSGGEVLKGLVRRRAAEADLYFTEWNEPVVAEVEPDPEPDPEPEHIPTLTGYLQSEGLKQDNIIIR